MGTNELAQLGLDSAALNWARQHFDYETFETVAEAPWSKTYRLARADRRCYLKLVPAAQAPKLRFTRQLAARFAGRVPQVIAAEPSKGWLLSADHGGRDLDYGADPADLAAVLRSYASLQAQCAKESELWAGAEAIDASQLVSRLLAFLEAGPAGADSAGAVHAEYFLGAQIAGEHLQLVRHHRERLENHLRAASRLPTTINHGDLRPPNTAVAPDGTGIMIDWDDAAAGPAGMSLQGMFGGCVVPSILLSDSPAAQAAQDTPKGLLMRAYLDTLAEAGYATVAELRQALPASMCAGLIQFILTFARYPSPRGLRAVRETINRRLNDLVDLCDWLAAKSTAEGRELARTYEAMGETERARKLYRDQVARQPQRAELIADLARTCLRLEDFAEARECYTEALRLAPEDAALHIGMAAVDTAELKLEQAQRSLREALAREPRSAAAAAAWRRVSALSTMREAAAEPERMPSLDFEIGADGRPLVGPEEVAMGAELFEKYGTVQIRNAFPPQLIARLQQAFFERYEAYFREGDHPDALRLGDRRYMLTVDMLSPFDDADLLGAPTVMPIVRRVVGDDCVLGAFTAVISLPGSRDQKLHKDHPALFPNTPWAFTVPCFAAQIIIPLIPLDDMTGTTRFFKGSHRIPTEEAQSLEHQDPKVELGSCLLMDYRCAHHGLGNRSDRVRPILTLIFNRPWFHDYRNYGKQPPLRISGEAFARLPPRLQAMRDWWQEGRHVMGLERSVLL